MKKVKCWWSKDPQPGNMGDIITPVLITKLFNKQCQWVNTRKDTEHHYLMTGSILQLAKANTTVWGSGAITESFINSPDAEYLSVRGPVSYELLKRDGATVAPIFGDPALTVPLFHKNNMQKKFKIGIVPHYVDYKNVRHMYRKDRSINVINILDSNPINVINQMLRCEKIVTSSLHGIIISHAYGMPVAWVKYSNLLFGDGIKFKDHFLSVGIDKYTCTELNEYNDEQQLDKLHYTTDAKIDTNKMLMVLEQSLASRIDKQISSPYIKDLNEYMDLQNDKEKRYPTIISFFTNSWLYRKYALELRDKCNELGLNYYICGLENAENYLENTKIKPRFILNALEKLNHDVLWIDADAILHKTPDFFIDFQYDFGSRKKPVQSEREWHVGTMYFKYNNRVISFMNNWIEQLGGKLSDEHALDELWKLNKFNGISTSDIPVTYFNIIKSYEQSNNIDDLVISHRISSGDSKMQLKKSGIFV